MKKKILYSVVGLLSVTLIGVAIFIFELQLKYDESAKVLDYEMNKMIGQKDYKQMKKVAIDYKTYEFLKELPSKTKVRDTTDPQGGTKNTEYRGTVVTVKGKEKTLWITMRKNNHNWKIDSIQK